VTPAQVCRARRLTKAQLCYALAMDYAAERVAMRGGDFTDAWERACYYKHPNSMTIADAWEMAHARGLVSL